MKKLSYLIALALILGLVLTGCSLLSNISQVPTTGQSGITYLTKGFLSNLVGQWHFDEGTGIIAYDSSGNYNDGTINGATYDPDQWGGQALSFDGVDDYVDCGATVDNSITTGITLEAWIKPAFKQNGGIISNDITYSSKKGYDFFLWIAGSSYGRLYIDFGNGSALGRTWWDIPSSDWYNQWHHVAATWDDITITLYADGSKVAEVEYSGSYCDPGKNTFIGAINYSTPAYYYFDRLIDEVRIYDCALSPDTIADHAEGIYGFNGLLTPYAPPDQKVFKLGSTIPIKWQYTDSSGEVFDSIDANPEVKCQFAGGGNGDGDLISPVDPGSSGLRYNSDTRTWQFNWQTKGLITGIGKYNIWIASKLTGQVNGPFLIELR